MTDPIGTSEPFAMARIEAALGAAEARLDTLTAEMEPNEVARLRQRISDARRELDEIRKERFPITAREKTPFWRYLLDSADSEPSLPA